MLIEKQVEVNDIVSLKLVTQEELVAKVAAIDSNSVTIQKPMILNIAMDEATRRPGIQMYPFFMLGANPDAKLTINRNHIVVLTASNDEIKKGYMANTSGLAIPGASDSGLIA